MSGRSVGGQICSSDSHRPFPSPATLQLPQAQVRQKGLGSLVIVQLAIPFMPYASVLSPLSNVEDDIARILLERSRIPDLGRNLSCHLTVRWRYTFCFRSAIR